MLEHCSHDTLKDTYYWPPFIPQVYKKSTALSMQLVFQTVQINHHTLNAVTQVGNAQGVASWLMYTSK